MGGRKLVWNAAKCRFSEGCSDCALACPKGLIAVGEAGMRYCRHCNPKYAVCSQACPNGAIVANKQGVLVVIKSRCDGCGKCAQECATGGICVRAEKGIAEKCDLCAALGKEPLCVAACKHGALELADDGQEESLAEIPEIGFAQGANSSNSAEGGAMPPARTPAQNPAAGSGERQKAAPFDAGADGAGQQANPAAGSGDLQMKVAPARLPGKAEARKIARKDGSPLYVGDGKRIPTVRYQESLPFFSAERRFASELSFRNLYLPPGRKARLLEANNGARIYEVEEVGKVYYLDFPFFTEENWRAAEQAKYFTIRHLAEELLGEVGEGSGYFSKVERKAHVAKVAKVAEKVLGELEPTMDAQRKAALARIIAADTAGFGPVEFLWMDGGGELEEVEINHPCREIAVYHRKHGRCMTNLVLRGEKQFRRVMNSILRPIGNSLDNLHPAVDAQLPDGSRLHAQIYPLALSGASANIRFFTNEGWTIPMMIKAGTISAEMGAFLWMAVESRKASMVITGPPAAGKTSFLSALLAFIPKGERVISVEEEMNELRFYDTFIDWVPLRGAYEERKQEAARKAQSVSNLKTPIEQVINALRMRPDRIIVGELRGAEAQKLFSSANLGMPFMATMHSNERGTAVVKRLHSPPMNVPADALSQLDLVVSMTMDAEKKRRVTEISELAWRSRGHFPEGLGEGGGRGKKANGARSHIWENGEDAVFANCLYVYDYLKRRHCGVANYPSSILDAHSQIFGRKRNEAAGEIGRRAAVLDALAEGGKTGFLEVGRAVQDYYNANEEGRAAFAEKIAGG